MFQKDVIYPKPLPGFSTNGAGFLGVIIDRIGLVALGSTKGTDQVLKKNVQADEGNPGQPRCEVFH